LGSFLDFPENGSRELVQLNRIEGTYRIVLEQSRWLQMEGMFTFGLYENNTDRFFHLSFCVGTRKNELVVYVGGIQGAAKPDAVAQHRRFTRRAHGMRPKDFLVESFKLFCRCLGVNSIYAVSGSSHVNATTLPAVINYDDFWIERGGVLSEDGFFLLPTINKRRSESDIPQRKQSLYRRRYEFLDGLARDICSRTKQG
jgi:uncharacterized protein VirK/YbjX